jgi:hypothetical protein
MHLRTQVAPLAALVEGQEASMSLRNARTDQYRWWLLDGDLDLVTDGSIEGNSLPAVLANVSRAIERLGDDGMKPSNHPYRLIVYKGIAVVAVRPATIGIC